MAGITSIFLAVIKVYHKAQPWVDGSLSTSPMADIITFSLLLTLDCAAFEFLQSTFDAVQLRLEELKLLLNPEKVQINVSTN